MGMGEDLKPAIRLSPIWLGSGIGLRLASQVMLGYVSGDPAGLNAGCTSTYLVLSFMKGIGAAVGVLGFVTTQPGSLFRLLIVIARISTLVVAALQVQLAFTLSSMEDPATASCASTIRHSTLPIEFLVLGLVIVVMIRRPIVRVERHPDEGSRVV